MRRNAILKTLAAVSALAVSVSLSPAALAELSASEVARLGKDLTPTGGEKAGNADGSIPAWNGGLTGGDRFANPFAGEKPLFTITAANAGQYKDKLAPGQLALLQRYPTYKINVYPSHRTAALPEKEYEIIKKEALTAKLVDGGNGMTGVSETSVPFPIPKSGVEPIWNHVMRYRGGSFIRYGTEFPVHTNGSFTPLRRTEWYARAHMVGEPQENRISYYKNLVTAPSSIAGEAILSHDPLDQVSEARLAWTYNPGQRRVLRAPSVSYDSPGTGTDGLRTMDDYDGYNGAPDRFDWKLMGKKEMYISYNNFKLADPKLKYEEIIQPTNINPDLVRYELHRVWHVQATVKSGVRHLYSKRDYYVDEDTWTIAHKDEYDGRGELWRVHEVYIKPEVDVKVPHYAGNALYDLQARRYLAHQINNEEKPTEYGVSLKLSDFSPDALRRIGK